MIALKLVRLIEAHSYNLAHGLIRRIEQEPKCAGMAAVPALELEQRAFEVYHNLTDWLTDKTEREIEATYKALGIRRAEQGVPFAAFYWALVVTKDHLCEFVREEGFSERNMDLFGIFELHRLVDQFFERAIYYAAQGYAGAKQRVHAVA